MGQQPSVEGTCNHGSDGVCSNCINNHLKEFRPDDAAVRSEKHFATLVCEVGGYTEAYGQEKRLREMLITSLVSLCAAEESVVKTAHPLFPPACQPEVLLDAAEALRYFPTWLYGVYNIFGSLRDALVRINPQFESKFPNTCDLKTAADLLVKRVDDLGGRAQHMNLEP